MNSYPKWLYKYGSEPALVNDPSEQEALGDGWFETPQVNSVNSEQREQVNRKAKK